MVKFSFLAIMILNVSSLFCLKCQREWKQSLRCVNVSSDLVLPPSDTILSLIIEDSKLSTLPKNSSLQLFHSLTELMLKHLHIEEISVGALDGLTNLEHLVLSRNKLERILPGTFNGLIKLENLFLSENVITQISADAFAGLNSLKRLFLQTNLIDTIDTNAFSNLVELEMLDLSQNNLTILQDNLFKNLKNLQVIILEENPLKEIHEVMFSKNIKKILLSSTTLNKIDFVISVRDDFELDLSYGNLKEIDFAKFQTEIRNLVLFNNSIHTVKNFNLLVAEYVNLNENNFEELVLPENVKHLYLSTNKIKNVVVASDPGKYTIKELDLSNNKITTASCFNLLSLDSLNFQKNLIEIVQKSDLTGCSNLTELYLGENRIETVEKNAFKELKFLKTLELSNNNIKILDFEDYLGLINLEAFYFDNNQIVYFDVASLQRNIPNVRLVKTKNSFTCENFSEIFRKLRWHNIKPTDVTYVQC